MPKIFEKTVTSLSRANLSSQGSSTRGTVIPRILGAIVALFRRAKGPGSASEELRNLRGIYEDVALRDVLNRNAFRLFQAFERTSTSSLWASRTAPPGISMVLNAASHLLLLGASDAKAIPCRFAFQCRSPPRPLGSRVLLSSMNELSHGLRLRP
jgi:hypothetical protein